MDGGGKIKSQYCTFLYIVLFLQRVFWITVLAVQLAGGTRFRRDLTLLWSRLSRGEKDENNLRCIFHVDTDLKVLKRIRA